MSFNNPGGGFWQLSTYGGFTGVSATTQVTASLDQVLKAESHSFVQHGAGLGAGAGADATMGFQIVVYGPSSILVPIHLSGLLNASSNSYGLAGGNATAAYHLSGYSQFDSGDRGLNVKCGSTNGGAAVGQCGGTHFTSNFEATAFSSSGTGHAISIGLDVHTDASSSNFFVGDPAFDGLDRSADDYATADPYAQIDSVWLAAHPGYGIEFSQGFVNGAAPGVPEPASWALMLTGFGIAGSALRRRRRLVPG